MDNVTHTLIGALVGDAATRTIPLDSGRLPPAARRTLFVSMMAIGSNLPDLDFLYSHITGSKLDYLLHHRGHTHTVLGALGIALAMLAVCELWMRRRGLAPSRADRLRLAAIAVLAPLLHITLDFTNSYGVHPFWPIYDGWMYGDSVFILEPLLWAAAAPLVFVLQTRVARTLVAIALATGIVLSFTTGLVPIPLAIALTALTAAMLLVGRYCTQRKALAIGLAAWLSITATFVVAGRIVEHRLSAFVTRNFPDRTVLDRILNPLPANPFCWDAMLVQISGEEYRLTSGTLALAPDWLPAAKCPSRTAGAALTAPLRPVHGPDAPFVQWQGEMTMPRNEIAHIAAASCEAAAFLRFARAVWAMPKPDGWIIGDLRYDREPGLGFAEFAVEPDNVGSAPGTAADGITQESIGKHCPRHLPPWIPPRSDLLGTPSCEHSGCRPHSTL